MGRKAKVGRSRVDLSESAFQAHETLTGYTREALRLALLAEAMGKRRTAGQLRAAAAMMTNAKGMYVRILREGYSDRRAEGRSEQKKR